METEVNDISRDIAGETVAGFRVAAYRETHSKDGDQYGHRYSEHWSTPSQNPAVKVERLFTEDQLRAALAEGFRAGERRRETMADSEMVERVAKAMRAELGVDWPFSGHEQLLDVAAAAIKAMREPTDYMTYIGSWEVGPGGSQAKKTELAKAWRAMIDAALKAPE